MASRSIRPIAIHYGKLRHARLPERLVARPQLHTHLDHALRVPLTVVIAPAGFGKSTLVAEWLQAGSIPYAWVTLDQGDARAERFAAHLAAAVAPLAPSARAFIDDLMANTPAPMSEIGASLADALFDLPDDAVIVLDDCDRAASPEIGALLDGLIAQMPRLAHLVLIARADPPLPLVRMRGRGQLNEVRAMDIRFTAAETQSLLAKFGAAEADAATVAALHEQTNGWPAALAMAARALPSLPPGSTAAFATGGASRLQMMQFFIEEVLAQQAPEAQALLLRTSIVDRFTAELAEALLDGSVGPRRSAEIIDRLVRADLVLEPIVDRPGWVRSQPIFRDLLLHHLTRGASQAAIADLRRRAGAWLADHDLIDEAIPQLLAGGDEIAAAELVERRAQRALDHEAWDELRGWLDLLPDHLTLHRPGSTVARAWVAHLSGRAAPMRMHLAAAAALLADADVSDRQVATWRGEIDTLSLSTLLPIEQDPAAALRLAERAASLIPAEHRFAAGLASGYISFGMYALGWRDDAIRRLADQAEREAERIDAGSIRGLLGLIFLYRQAGAFLQCAETSRHTLSLCERHDLPVTAGWARLFLGWIAYEQDDLAAAIDRFDAIVSDYRRMHLSCVREAMFGLALAYQAQGRERDADEALRRLEDIIVGASALEHLSAAQSFAARLALIRQQPDRAIRWLVGADIDIECNTLHAFEHALMTRVKTLIAIGSADSLAAAERDLRALVDRAERAHFEARLVEIWALAALVHHGQGRHAEAAEAMQRSLCAAPGAEMVRTYLDLGPATAAILQSLEPGSSDNRRLRSLLGRYAGATTTPLPSSKAPPIDLLLTARELDVLACLGERLSYKEIGERLFISPMTVKRHAGSIYGKLDVGSRRQALAKARELGWRPAT
jgi:ATP/maltotriose-dependent transcriptional regulator MalT